MACPMQEAMVGFWAIEIVNVAWLRECAIFTPKDDKASKINEILMNSYAATEQVYQSLDSVIGTSLQIKVLHSNII